LDKKIEKKIGEMSAAKKLSLAPLSFKEAASDLLKIRPEPKPVKGHAKKRKENSGQRHRVARSLRGCKL
jgi:hypothetical protein